MTADTILIAVPADDPLGLLAPSVGGATPPLRVFHIGKQVWIEPDLNFHSGHALLLSLNGRPDDLGMARAVAVLATLLGRTEPERTTYLMRATAWLEMEADDGDAWPVGLWIAHDGVAWYLKLPEGFEGDEERAVAHCLTERAPAYRVVVVDGEGREVVDGR